MTKEIELAKQHGIKYLLTPEGTTEIWYHDRNLQAFAEALVAAERERCAKLCDAKHAIRAKDGFPREASTARALAKAIRGAEA